MLRGSPLSLGRVTGASPRCLGFPGSGRRRALKRQSVIHIVNGDSAGGTIQQALGLKPSRDLLVSHDLYSCGPLPAIASLKDWHQNRLSWWLTIYGDQGQNLS